MLLVLLVFVFFGFFLVESFVFSFLSCSFTSNIEISGCSARLTKLESTRLRAHDDVLFDRPQILLGSPLSMLSFVVGWFVVF